MSNSETFAELNGLEIAVIGMAGRFPGARNIEQFWLNLRDGVESISFFTDEEVLAAGVDPAWLKDPKLVKAGGILEDIDLFDAPFFGYSPREAEIIDPQQRFFLECAWEALEHAGYDAETYKDSIGVYAGVGMSGYLANIFSNKDLVQSLDTLQIVFGNDKDHLATRVAYKLNLKGPAVAVQSACSTSLVATYMACQGLLGGACDMALAGGVTIGVNQKSGYLYQEGGILSPDGHTRAFDFKAQGCVGGSGVGIVILKRLEDALADGDTIYAVIKGATINNDGSMKVGYTAPSIEGQTRAIKTAQAMAEIEPETITYVEAHGTGTVLGDPIEVAALTQAFRARTQKKNFCALGSVKTNIGHLDAASGVSGLIKTVLSLKHQQIPPSLNFESPNSQIDFANSPFYVNTHLSEWTTSGHTRRAGVSSFGIGGTNAHLVLEEAPAIAPSGESRPWQLLVLSAKTQSALETVTTRLVEHLKQNPGLPLADISYTLQVGRRALDARRAIVCRSVEDAVAALERRDPQRILTGVPEADNQPVVFMFPGQGSQYVKMGQELYRTEPAFREQIDLCSEILQAHLGLDLRNLLYPRTGEAEQAVEKLNHTLFTQAALFVIEYSLARLWMSWGVFPQAMIGHSLGEYVAACLAEVFSLEDALKLVVVRGRLMSQMPAGSMLAVSLSEAEVQQMLTGTQLSLAAVNGESICVISGPHNAVQELAHRLDEENVHHRLLHTSHAFHSAMMDPILGQFRDYLSDLRLHPPQRPFISNVTGDWITADEAINPQYWTRHLRHTVRFDAGLKTLLKRRGSILLELGPGDTLSSLTRRHSEKRAEHVALPSMRSHHQQEPDEPFLLRTLAQCWLSGGQVDWAGFYAHEQRRRLPLPTYPFERQRYWIKRHTQPEALDEASQSTLHRKPSMADWFYVQLWKQSVSPLSLEPDETAEPIANWLIFADECGLATRIAERLEQEGHEVVIVKRGAEFIKLGERAYAIDHRQRDDYDRLFGELRSLNLVPHHLVHLWNVTEKDERHSERELFETSMDDGFYSLLFLAQALGEQVIAQALGTEKMSDDLHLTIVSNNMQKVFAEEQPRPEKSTLLGACKVIPQEYPHLTCRSIDVRLATSLNERESVLAEQLLAELKSKMPDQIIAYRGRERWTQSFEPVRLNGPARRPLRLRERGVYLITGGLGGVGLELAEYLASTLQAKLALIGRSSFPTRASWPEWLAGHDERNAVSQKIGRLMALEKAGAELLILSADVTSQPQLEAAVAETTRKFGEINGVIHAAGITPSSLIQRKTREMAAMVLAPKVAGTLTLHAIFQHAGLDFFLLCSSLRALIGGPGNIDYCAANAFLDAFARRHNNDTDSSLISVNWDGWVDIGMSRDARASAGPGAEGNEEGMSGAEAVEAFGRILANRLPQVIVSTRDLQTVLEREQSQTAASALERLEQSHTSAALVHPRPQLRDSYLAPRNEAEQTLVGIWQELLGVDGIGVHDNFFELGGDSVISIRIIAKANQAGIHLTPKQVFECQTIAELAAASDSGATSLKAEQGLITGPVPLTPIQHWFFEQKLPAPHHFNQAILLEVRRKLDYRLLEKAVIELLAHHDALRHRFTQDETSWLQFGTSPDEVSSCALVDLSAVPVEDQRQAIEAAATTVQSSLNLADGPLMHVVLFDLGERQPGRLLIVIHHLAVDAVSWRILLEDLETAYRQLSLGAPVRLPAKTTSYKQWAERLLEHAQSEALKKELDDWLAGPLAEVSPLPVDNPKGASLEASTRKISVSLSEEETRALLQEVPRVYQTQINDALLTALATTFNKWTGHNSLLVHIEGHGREPLFEDLDLSRTVGWFTTIYPVLLHVEASHRSGDALKIIKEHLRGITQGGIGYGALRYLCTDREVAEKLQSLPRAEVSFLYLGQGDQVLPEDSWLGPATESCGPQRSPQGHRSYLLEVVGSVLRGRLSMTWMYSDELYCPATVEALAEGFVETLRSIIAHCRATEEKGYTPSDFAAFGWSQNDLDEIMAKISEATKST
jgi:non-ribosomal peptide synthase protein (TIGR01720 family)